MTVHDEVTWSMIVHHTPDNCHPIFNQGPLGGCCHARLTSRHEEATIRIRMRSNEYTNIVVFAATTNPKSSLARAASAAHALHTQHKSQTSIHWNRLTCFSHVFIEPVGCNKQVMHWRDQCFTLFRLPTSVSNLYEPVAATVHTCPHKIIPSWTVNGGTCVNLHLSCTILR